MKKKTILKTAAAAALSAALLLGACRMGIVPQPENIRVSVPESGLSFIQPAGYVYHAPYSTFNILTAQGLSEADAQNWMDVGYSPYYLDFYDTENDVLVYLTVRGDADPAITGQYGSLGESGEENAAARVEGGTLLNSGLFKTPAADYLYREISTENGLLLQSYYTEVNGGQVQVAGISRLPAGKAKKRSMDSFVESLTFSAPKEDLPV